MSEAKRLFDVLFSDADAVQIRVLHETEKRALTNRVFHSPSEALDFLERNGKNFAAKNAFPCVGVNPRELSAESEVETLRNIVVDIDGAPLPAWASERADVICSRDALLHHLYFCFAPMGATEKNRKKYSHTYK